MSSRKTAKIVGEIGALRKALQEIESWKPPIVMSPPEMLQPELVALMGEKQKGLPPQARIKLPKHWPKLPENAPIEVELDWVHANLSLCRHTTNAGKDHMRLELSSSPAPSQGALTWMEFAIAAATKFGDIYSRIKVKAPESEDERIRHDRKSIAEIEAMLERLGGPDTA